MANGASNPRPTRALGAILLVIVATATLRAGHRRWMIDQPASAFRPHEVQLDLAAVFPFAAHRNGAGGAPPAREGARVELPPGSVTAWSVRVPASGGLGAEAIKVAPDSGAELRIESDGEPHRIVALEACGGGCRLALPEFADRIARLTVTGPKPSAPGAAPLVLVAPVLYGETLRPLIELGDPNRDGAAPTIGVSVDSTGNAIREGRWKLVKSIGRPHPLALYDLDVDPLEHDNVARAHPIRVRYLLEEVARIEARSVALAPTGDPPERALSVEKTEELRASGYGE